MSLSLDTTGEEFIPASEFQTGSLSMNSRRVVCPCIRISCGEFVFASGFQAGSLSLHPDFMWGVCPCIRIPGGEFVPASSFHGGSLSMHLDFRRGVCPWPWIPGEEANSPKKYLGPDSRSRRTFKYLHFWKLSEA